MNKSIIAASIIRFLENEARSVGPALSESEREGLLVAASCVRQSYHVQDSEIKQAGELESLFPSSSDSQPSPQPSASAQSRVPVSEERRQKAESLKAAGNDHLAANRALEALENYTRALELDPNNAVYYCNRAAAFTLQGEFDSAVEDCLAAITINGKYPKAYSRLGTAYLGLKSYKKAAEAFEKAVSLEPGNASYTASLEQARRLITSPSPSATNTTSAPSPPTRSNPSPSFSGGSMPDLSALMQNPQLMQMASQMMGDPNAMSNLMSNPNIASM